MNRELIRASVALVVAGVLAACSGGPGVVADKAGADTLVLRLATIDDVNNNGQSFGPEAFVAKLADVSGGRLRVEVTKPYGDGAADAESRLVQAIASGELDGGWPSTRAFAKAGIRGLEAVEAPFTLASYAVQKALVNGPLSKELLSRLEGSGVVGLGLAVGPLRRPFSAERPLLEPKDWRGIRFRAYNSPVQADTIRALGGEPVNLGFEWIDQITAGKIDGVEFDVAQYAKNGFTTEAGFVAANLVLWPKVFVLGISQRRYASLTAEQRSWVREAATAASEASVKADYDENRLVTELCERGVKLAMATDEQLDALRGAIAPVIDALADGEAGAIVAKIRALAAQYPQTDVLKVPPGCAASPGRPRHQPAPPRETSALPDGVYRVQITPAEVEAAGISNGPGWSGTWTLTVEGGTYVITCRPLQAPGRDCGNTTYHGPLEAGHLKGTGSTVYFVSSPELMSKLTGCKLPVSTAEGHCNQLDLFWMRWSLDGDTLTFSDPGGIEAHDKTIKPWKKIA